MNTATANTAMRTNSPARVVVWGGALLTGLFVWSFWPTIAELVEFWRGNDDYSVGQLVPLVAVYLVWRERGKLAATALRPNWWGLAIVGVGLALRFGGLYYAYASAERLALVVMISGVILLVAGWRVWRHLIWVQVFLLLMLPLPQRVHNLISLPLQDWATALGLFGLELLGFFVAREGNILYLNDNTTLMVAEACSGLRMLTAFIFTAAVLIFLVQRPAWHKVAILLSSIPVAVLANGLRVLVTAIFVHFSQDPALEQHFHDLAGLLMMPLAIVVLLGELKLLAVLTAPSDRQNPRIARGARAGRPAAAHGGRS